MRYDREVLLGTLIAHQRMDVGGCRCGPLALGSSLAEHVRDAYELAITADERYTHDGVRSDKAVRVKHAH